jgi:hypothetical protein
MKNDAQGVPMSGTDAAYTMSHRDFVYPAHALYGAMLHGKDHRIALL